MKQLEITGCLEVRLPYSNRTVLVPDGYKLVREPYCADMALVPESVTEKALLLAAGVVKSQYHVQDLGREIGQDTVAEVDKTINTVCKEMNQNIISPELYADTVKALAALIEARDKLC